MSARPVLRYFDCRSRGQALRFALVDTEVDFEDARVPTNALADFQRAVKRGENGSTLSCNRADGRVPFAVTASAHRITRVHRPMPG